MTPLEMTTLEIRQTLRNKRKALSLQHQELHAQKAFNVFKEWLQSKYPQPSKIAFFLSQDGELNTHPCIEYLFNETQHQVYLPVLQTRTDLHMAFAHYHSQSTMVTNKFGIKEPKESHNKHFSGEDMDIVMMPLVGFDNHGNRLGMGGGYYDRTFEFKLNRNICSPKLIGWAHQCQQLETLPHYSWDVPLDGIITENGYHSFK